MQNWRSGRNGSSGVMGGKWWLEHRFIGIDFFLRVSGLSCMVYMDRATYCLLRCKSVFNSCHRNRKVDCFTVVVEINECETPMGKHQGKNISQITMLLLYEDHIKL